jgi:uncharacterized membrane protein
MQNLKFKIKNLLVLVIFAFLFIGISNLNVDAQGGIRSPQMASPTPIASTFPKSKLNEIITPVEEIQNFESDIVVNKDSTLTVTETIKINSTNDQIRHGIFRDFPTKYHWKYGLTQNTTFKVLKVQRDGNTEPYSTQNLDNGVRLMIGSSDSIIKTGIHTYTISYITGRQLGDFKSTDELYYNITGNGWGFPINSASATITLPERYNDDQIDIFGYTGLEGLKGTNYETLIDRNGANSIVKIRTTNPLQIHEGLTISVDWPKGAVKYPFDNAGIVRIVEDNIVVLTAALITFLLLGYYLFFWNKYGRDPQKNAIVPLFYPPDNLSPAASRYIYNGSYDNKSIVAAIVNLGVNGFVAIEEEIEKVFFISQKNYVIKLLKSEPKPENGDECILVDSLFIGSADSITLGKKYNSTFASASTRFAAFFPLTYRKTNFVNNAKFTALGILLTAFTIFIVVISNYANSLIFVLSIIIQIALHIIFGFLLRARTVEGSALRDKLEGFKRYLSTAESDDLRIMNQEMPDTFEIYQKYLPYAIAFDVETNWTSRFEKVIAAAQLTQQYNSSYLYLGGLSSFANSSTANDFTNSLSSTVSSASTIPGSSSSGGGSFGGGSSGGGGGGGGGGGW